MPSDVPSHIASQVDALREAGWVTIPEATELTGREVPELAMLMISEEADFTDVGPWWPGEVPRVVTMVELSSLRATPRRQPLRSV